MSLSTRLLAPIESAIARTTAGSGASYLCSTCRRATAYRPAHSAAAILSQCLPYTQQQHQLRHNSTTSGGRSDDADKSTFDETMKSKLWGKNAAEIEEANEESILEKRLRGVGKGAETAVTGEAESGAEQLAQDDEYAVAHSAVMATNWMGLPVHRGFEEKPWKKEPYAGDHYESFVSPEKITDHRLLLSIIHQATVEMLILRQLGKPLKDACRYVNHDIVVPLINRVNIVAGKDFETTTLEFGDETEKQKILAAFEDPAKTSPEDLTDIAVSVPKDLRFLHLPIENAGIKFVLLKRIAQLSGHFFPNTALPSFHTINHVLKHLDRASKPKPKKLVEVLAASPDLKSLPNVKIASKRVSISDKETEIGRWKIIEEELVRRGLPVNADAQR